MRELLFIEPETVVVGILAIAMGLFWVLITEAISTESSDGSIPLDERQVLGVILENGSRKAYGTAEEPSSVEQDRFEDDAETNTFEIGTRILTFVQKAGGIRTVSRIVVIVDNPTAVWSAAPDPEEPVRSIVETTGRDLAAAEQVIGDLSADRLEQALAESGLSVLSTEAQRTIEQTYEIEIASGDWYEVTVRIHQDELSDTEAENDLVLTTLRDGLGAIDDEQEQLDASTLAEHIDESAVEIATVRPCEAPAEVTAERALE